MDVLLSSRNGDMFYGVQHLYRLPPGSTVHHTENHLAFVEAVEWISPGRFRWEQVSESEFFEHRKRSLGPDRGEYSSPVYNGGPGRFSVVDMSENTLSLVDKTREAFRRAIPACGPVLVFPTAKSSRKELTPQFVGSVRWPRNTIVCVEPAQAARYSGLGLGVESESLRELIVSGPRAVVGACSFPVLLFCWLGFRCLKVHAHPFTRPPRAPLDHLGGDEVDAEPGAVDSWLSQTLISHL